MESIFGPLLSTWNVDQAVLATLSLWWDEYLAEVERQNNVPGKTIPRPPSEESFRRALDFEYYEEDDLPAVIVVSKPSGDPEVNASVGYTQRYEVQVGCVCEGEDEQAAQMRAAFYGAASQLLVQQSELGGFAQRTRMITAPELDMPDDEDRWLCRSIATFHVWVAQIVVAEAGPITPPGTPGPEGEEHEPEQPYPEWPDATQTHITVTAEPVD
jgi:hypothetical protein